VENRLKNQIQLPGFRGLVATEDDLIAGAIWWESISIERLRQERGEVLVGFVQGLMSVQNMIWEREVIVAPSYQGRGLGRALRQEFLQKVCFDFNPVLILTRMRDDNLPIVKIAQQIGFLRTGIKVPSSQVPGLNHEYWYYKGVANATVRGV
jgi:GNAT superfamily N-acetyltransferase